MRKSIVLVASLSVLISSVVFGQNHVSYTCYYYDSDTVITDFKNFVIDSNANCLDITGAVSSKILKGIFSGVTHKDKIEKIELTNYSGKSIPSVIKGFKNLTSLTVTASPDVNFRQLFSQLHILKLFTSLKLDDNASADIPSNIKSLENLKSLSVTNYSFVDADKLFNNLVWIPGLQDLTLASTDNILLAKNPAFPKSLKTLDLSDNWLSYLPRDISKTMGLQSLDISENNFADAGPVMNLIDSLPLKSLKITCYDTRDSMIVCRTFPGLNMQVSIYHEFQKTNSYKKLIKEEPNTAISNIYSQYVTPKVGNLEIVRKTYSIDAKQTTSLFYQSGTSIRIPEEAFVDSAGNTINGNVNIYYREYGDILDIFANGVPMSYDSAGENYAFRTAGMFEIYATKDNKQVFLKPGKKISLDFAIVDTSNGFNLYRLDQKTGNWNFNTPLNNKIVVKNFNTSDAYNLYKRRFRKWIDTTRFEERYNDSLYARTMKITPNLYFSTWKSYLPNIKLKRVFHYAKDKEIKKSPIFTIDNNEFRYEELNIYRNYAWVYSGPLNRKEFAKKYVYRKNWTDSRISYLPSENLYEIELKSPSGNVSFRAYPIRPEYTTETAAYAKTYLKLDNRYSKVLNRVKTRFDKRLNKEIARNLINSWNEISRLMTPEEKAMSKEEWIAYANKRMKMEKDSLNNFSGSYENMTRSFEIDGFGIWNCDQILRLKYPVQFMAHFKDAYNNSIAAFSVNVIDTKSKSILSYPGGLAGSKIVMDPTSETAIFVTMPNGLYAIVDKNSIKNTITDKVFKDNYTFTAYKVDPMLISTGELRKLMGIE